MGGQKLQLIIRERLEVGGLAGSEGLHDRLLIGTGTEAHRGFVSRGLREHITASAGRVSNSAGL